MKIYKNPIWNKLFRSLSSIKIIQHKDSQLITDLELNQIMSEQTLTDLELEILTLKGAIQNESK